MGVAFVATAAAAVDSFVAPATTDNDDATSIAVCVLGRTLPCQSVRP